MKQHDNYVKKLLTAWEEVETKMDEEYANEPNPTWAFYYSHPAENIKDAHEYERVFRQYLELCNLVIKHNKSKFLYTRLWRDRFKALKSEVSLHTVVYGGHPKLSFILRLTPDMEIEIVERKEVLAEEESPFTYEYLKHVVDHPEEYINHPAKLEWGWLKSVFEPNSLANYV